MNEKLVKLDKLSEKIKELPFYKRIETNMPILVRAKVATMLKNAVLLLPDEISLQIDGGYRSPKVQEILWNNRVKELGLIKATSLVSNPYVNKSIPGHTTGGAVDISLLDKNMKEINLSAPFTKYYDEQELYSKKITKEAQKLRLLLYKAMLSAGFAPCDNEYWHFSYGDEKWAKYYNKKPIYNQIKNPEKYYYPFILRYYYKVMRRLYKLINKIFKLKTNY